MRLSNKKLDELYALHKDGADGGCGLAKAVVSLVQEVRAMRAIEKAAPLHGGWAYFYRKDLSLDPIPED